MILSNLFDFNLMANTSRELIKDIELLKKENEMLQQQLKAAKESFDGIKSGNIDALVIAHEKAIKVYTEKTADKPYRILIEKMHEGAVTLYEDGTILYCNSSFAKMVNLPLQKIIGTIFEKFIDDSLKEHFEVLLKQSNVKALKQEGYLYANGGKGIPVLLTANALLLDNVFVLSIIITDLTIQNENQEKLRRRTKQLEQKNIELENTNIELAVQIEEKEKRGAELTIAKTDVKELEVLNTHKDSILSTLSHDLRSPLAAIIGMADELKENFETLDNSTVKELLTLLYKASKNELSMLDSMVEWARIKYASEAFSPSEINVVQYVKKVFDILNENAVANNILLYSEIEQNINVYADGNMLHSILQNLISNSIKNTLTGGIITVRAKRKEDKIIVEIKDTGIGMAKEIMDKLFTPHMISLSSSRKKNKGAGIGLLLVKGFLEKNGGDIWVESIVNEGSSFYFTLPDRKPLEEVDGTAKIELAEK